MSQQFPPQYQQDSAFLHPAPPQRPRKIGLVTVIALVALILAIAVLLNESMLKIRNVAVIGNQRVSWDEAVEAAGLKRPLSFFSVNEERIARALQSNRYLIFERLEKHFPNGLTLYVRERQPTVRVQEMGAEYVLDQEGMVLERSAQLNSAEYQNLMMVTGLKPKEMRVGQMMVAGSSSVAEAYRALIQEITLQGVTARIAELNVSDPENLYLTTVDGFIAHLGTADQLRAKIGTVRAVADYLRNNGQTGGMLEANIPGEAVYSPLSP